MTSQNTQNRYPARTHSSTRSDCSPEPLNKPVVRISLPVIPIHEHTAVTQTGKQHPGKKHRLIRDQQGGFSAYRGIGISSNTTLKGTYGCWAADLLDEHGTPVKAITLKGLRDAIDRVLDRPTDAPR